MLHFPKLDSRDKRKTKNLKFEIWQVITIHNVIFLVEDPCVILCKDTILPFHIAFVAQLC